MHENALLGHRRTQGDGEYQDLFDDATKQTLCRHRFLTVQDKGKGATIAAPCISFIQIYTTP